MPPTAVPSAFPTAVHNGHGEEHLPVAGNKFKFGLIFWPILFGALLIALLWKLWTWKVKSVVTTSPLSTPKPSTSDVIRMAQIRGSPSLGRPAMAVRASSPCPPPPAYVRPPQYDNSPPPYGGGGRPS